MRRTLPAVTLRFPTTFGRGKARQMASDLLREAIAASGLSARQYAVQVLLRDERTVRRWLAGDSPIPKVVVDRLTQLLTDPQ